MSIRAAAGATTGRIVRQWFTESLLLAAGGGLAGLLLSHWITSGLLLFLPEAERGFYAFALDGSVLAVSLAATVSTAVIFGVLPGWRAARDGRWKDAGRGSVGAHAGRWVKWAMALQLAASLVLILGAALFARSLANLLAADYGFHRHDLVTAQLPPNDQEPFKLVTQRYRALIEQVRGLPRVKEATWGTDPLGGHVWEVLRVPGYVPAPGETTTVFWSAASPGYFAVMGTAILAGRDFNEQDLSGIPPRPVIVSESLARRYFGRLDVTGVLLDKSPIVGVVGNVRVKNAHEPMRDLS